MNANLKVLTLLLPCCGTYCLHSDKNPISDSSGAFRVAYALTMCHYFSQAKLPEDALDFT